jgi:hypothetical protein
MDKFKKILLYIWQLLQNLVGLIIGVFYKTKTTVAYKDKTVRVCNGFPGGISLGNTIIVNKYPNTKSTWNTVKHEYGHSIQSKWLGPFYLFVVGIPSILWAAWWNPNRGVSYYSFYTEKWADKLGEVKDRV